MKKPHKHAALIHAWADGLDIEFRNNDLCTWRSCPTPRWLDEIQYRIRPETKLDVAIAALDSIASYRHEDDVAAAQNALDRIRNIELGIWNNKEAARRD